MTLEGNGRASIREVHALVMDMRAEVRGEFAALRDELLTHMRGLSGTTEELAREQAEINGSVAARLEAMERQELRTWWERTVGAAVGGACGAGGLTALLLAVGKLQLG